MLVRRVGEGWQVVQVKAGQDQAAWEEQGWIREQDPRGEAALSCQLVWNPGTV